VESGAIDDGLRRLIAAGQPAVSGERAVPPPRST
jgi:hypothetical protein